MTKNVFIGWLMLASVALTSGSVLAVEPTLHQVYQAAEAGQLSQAQTMMTEVLAAHPNSGKAHFVEAELLVKQGQLQKAEAELANAERLAPGLTFAKPEAVQNLRAQLGSERSVRPVAASPVVQQSAPQSSMPWGILLIGAGLIAFIVFAARWMTQRNGLPGSGGGYPATYGSGVPSPAAPFQPYGAGGAGTMAAPGAGMGSRIMGGLATGAAVGVGVVAGEALMHRFMDGPESRSDSPLAGGLAPSSQDGSFDDLGGADFGVSDSASWDDGSSGGSDWS